MKERVRTCRVGRPVSHVYMVREGRVIMDNRRKMLIDTILTSLVALLVFATVWGLLADDMGPMIPAVGIAGLVVVCFVLIRYYFSPDHRRASQTNQTLGLATDTLGYLREGLSEQSAQAVCELLLPAIDACAVGLTNTDSILGYAGEGASNHPQGSKASVPLEKLLSEDGKPQVVATTTDIGVDPTQRHVNISAALIAPLMLRNDVIGALKLYYPRAHDIDETQQAFAAGMAQLLSTQLSLAELDAQTELATRMRLKALQAQINPHFLFNTINTIAALIRTDPDRARVLLREFAVFYRRILENSEDLIAITQEIDQTQRYLMFEKARFGEERIALDVHVEPDLEMLQVPAFIIQPIVENSVGHAMRDEGTLHITIGTSRVGDDVVVRVADDGVGMPADKVPLALKPGYGTGIGIALKNVDDRLKGYFGASSGIRIESELGDGTTVCLTLWDAKV